MTPALLYLLIGVGLVGTELLIMQFSVFWFLFFGLGALLTSFVCWLMPELSLVIATTIFLLSSLGFSAALYPILKKWQSKPSPIAGNDAIGQSAKVIKAISNNSEGKVFWSGADWPAELMEEDDISLEVGDVVTIRKLEGIRLFVSR